MNKLYLYGAGVLALLLAFGGYTLHERHVQRDIDKAADARAVTKANAAVAADVSTAKTEESQSALIYKQAVSIPAVADLGVVCKHASGSVPLPAAGAVTASTVGNPTADSGVGPAYDPTGPALTRGREADAEIAYLQRRVAELEKQMDDSP